MRHQVKKEEKKSKTPTASNVSWSITSQKESCHFTQAALRAQLVHKHFTFLPILPENGLLWFIATELGRKTEVYHHLQICKEGCSSQVV